MMDKKFVISGSIVMFLSVATGAFGAHALEGYFNDFPDLMTTYSTAVQYMTVHGLALFIVALMCSQERYRYSNMAGMFFILGIIFFSGSLFLLIFTQNSLFGAITPIGGVAFLTGWFTLGYTAWRN